MTNKPDYEPPRHYPLRHRIKVYHATNTCHRICSMRIHFNPVLRLAFEWLGYSSSLPSVHFFLRTTHPRFTASTAPAVQRPLGQLGWTKVLCSCLKTFVRSCFLFLFHEHRLLENLNSLAAPRGTSMCRSGSQDRG